MTYTEMFDCLKAWGFTLDFNPTVDPVGFSIRVYWKGISFGTMRFHNAMFYTEKDNTWVSQFNYGWTTNPNDFKEFMESFIKSCEEKNEA